MLFTLPETTDSLFVPHPHQVWCLKDQPGQLRACCGGNVVEIYYCSKEGGEYCSHFFALKAHWGGPKIQKHVLEAGL